MPIFPPEYDRFVHSVANTYSFQGTLLLSDLNQRRVLLTNGTRRRTFFKPWIPHRTTQPGTCRILSIYRIDVILGWVGTLRDPYAARPVQKLFPIHHVDRGRPRNPKTSGNRHQLFFHILPAVGNYIYGIVWVSFTI